MRLRATLVAPMVLAISLAASAADGPPWTALGVDMVSVRRGPRLFGVVLERGGDGAVSIAVRREWLRSTQPREYERRVAEEAAAAQKQRDLLTLRLSEWSREAGDEPDLKRFLDRERQRIAQPPRAADAAPPPQFLVVRVPAERVERVLVQPPQQRQPALLAWREKLDNVEGRSAAALLRELQEKQIDLAQSVDFSGDLPPQAESEAQWNARRAILGYRFVKSLDFQGTGDVLVRTGSGEKRPDMTQLAASILQTQLQSQLADLLDEPRGAAKAGGFSEKALAGAIQQAESAKVTGFRVTRMAFQPGAKSVVVEGRFIAQVAPGKWATVWQHTETTDASRAQPDLEKQIADNEEIKQVVELVKTAGLAGEDLIAQAIRAGAATQTAQQAVDKRFYEFFGRYTAHLDGPPLFLP